MVKNKSRWLFLTAAFGSEKYNCAANRLISQATTLNLFDKLHIATLNDLRQISPMDLESIPQELLNSNHKFGYYFWKPLIISAGLQGFWGEFDGVVYVDAGSEILPGIMSQLFFSFHFRNAYKNGISVFSIKTPEIAYTKREVLQFFNLGQEQFLSNQFQSGTIFLARDFGREICILWRDICRLNPPLIFPNTSRPQYSKFIEHRHEQSILSCLLRKIGVSESKWAPGGILINRSQQLLNLHRGVWWSRNITAESTVSKSLQYILDKTPAKLIIASFFKPPR